MINLKILKHNNWLENKHPDEIMATPVEVLNGITKGESEFVKGKKIKTDFYSDNEGHIFAKITNDSNEGKTVNIQAGTGFMQGIFVEYGITVDDEATGIRNGGFGSTTEKK